MTQKQKQEKKKERNLINHKIVMNEWNKSVRITGGLHQLFVVCLFSVDFRTEEVKSENNRFIKESRIIIIIVVVVLQKKTRITNKQTTRCFLINENFLLNTNNFFRLAILHNAMNE